MKSLRHRLFALLLAATGLIWICAVVWISYGSRSELEHVLDTRLQEAAKMVHSLVGAGNMAAIEAAPPLDGTGYTRQLACQVWSFDGRLVARSSGAPDRSLAQPTEGFADRDVDGESWRIYTIVDAAKGVRVAIGDRLGLRDRLVRDLVAGLVAPAVAIVPLLGLLTWFGLGTGLRPLNAFAGEIVGRDGEDMRPIADAGTPTEIRPLVSALNALFGKVAAARRNEREITAFAAHELRTPLAGLKTQTQIALAAADPAIRDGALRQILVSVDRTSRLVAQLLTLAKLEAAPPTRSDGPIDVAAVLADVVAEVPAPPGVAVAIDPDIGAVACRGDATHLHLVLRNLHENAVVHMRAPGRVAWRRLPGAPGLMIEDEGPGVGEDEIDLLTRRFWHGRRSSGTGLGLTIARLAAERLGGHLAFVNRPDRSGLRATLTWA